MNDINNYESFCKAFNGTNEQINRANILLFLRNWIVRLSDCMDQEFNNYGLDKLLIDNSDKKILKHVEQDVLSRILDDTIESFRYISNNMRENIIRENVMMPVYKVKEVNSQGFNWLSRRPGRSIKEKISGTSSIMAVQRRMSIDTGENRLFIAFLKELCDLLEVKMDNLPKIRFREEEYEYYEQIFSFLRNSNLSEIRRWENIPPNNTLLSDKNYKKIWNGWNELKKIDYIITNDNIHLEERICTLFYIEFLTKMCKYFRIPQVPVSIDYTNYNVEIHTKTFYAIDNRENILRLECNKNSILIKYKDKNLKIKFINDVLNFDLGDENETKYTFKPYIVSTLVNLALKKIGCNKLNQNNRVLSEIKKYNEEIKKYNEVVIDLLRLHPIYIGDNESIQKMQQRILQQSHTVYSDNYFKVFNISCEFSSLIEILDNDIETYTITTALNNASISQMSKLMHMMEEYIITNKLVFVFPDIYNEFQLSLIHKAARMAYSEVRSFPRSIGIAFNYQSRANFRKLFNYNDFILVVDLIDYDITFSLIQGIESQEVKENIPEYGGIIWEKHSSTSESCYYIVDEILDKLFKDGCIKSKEIYNLMGLYGIYDESNLLSFIFDEHNSYSLNSNIIDIINSTKINISNYITKFLYTHKNVIGSSKVHIISLCENFIYKGICSYEYMSTVYSLYGYKFYEELQKKVDISLWRDHLPQLAIKLLYGKFELVNDETIIPEFNVEKHIEIPEVFTLTKNRKEYHFNLVQNNNNSRKSFVAIVRNPAFPLKNDVKCKLDMIYKYGDENPYKLLFRPIKLEGTGFVEAKVKWEPLKEYPYKHLVYPEPIHSLKWSNMYTYECSGRVVNLIDELINRFNSIKQGYKTINIKNKNIKLHGIKKGSRTFNLKTVCEGKNINIIFKESNVEKTIYGKQITFEKLDVLSFELYESKNKKARYFVDLSDGEKFNTPWRYTKNGYTCYRTINIDGESIKVVFFDDQFDKLEDFNPRIYNISFEIKPHNDIYKAIKIHNEDSSDEYIKLSNYYAINIRNGNKPAGYIYSGWTHFLMLSTFLGKNSFYDEECPVELRISFENALNSWIKMYYDCDNDYIKSKLFNIMSIVANDIGDEYYKIADEYIDDYLKKNRKLPDYIGYALGDCKTQREQELIEKLYKLPDEKMVCILSKSIWGNEDFIWELPISKSLKYFDIAIDYLKRLCNGKKGKDITMCLEYILGVFRLRKYNDKDLNFKLSLNNPKVQQLYSYVEKIIENNIDVRSFLNLEVTNKGIYEDIPDLLYAMLIYITGQQDSGEIRISGISKDDIDI